MNIQESVKSLTEMPEYMIVAFSIDESDVILFVDAIVPAQAGIPKLIDGREVKIVKAM